MDNCNIVTRVIKLKEIDGELYISCWDFSKVLSEKEREISDLCKENDELKKQISELESELAVKEDLLKIKNGSCGKEPLPFSCDEYTDALFEELEDLRDRHQQDCITINQLHTTIDTLIERYAKLREMRGVQDMAKQVIEVKETGDCSQCAYAIKDRNQEVIGCRNGINNPCIYREDSKE